jgi:predicted nucleotidyltransferase
MAGRRYGRACGDKRSRPKCDNGPMKENLEICLASIAHRYGIESMYVFGSRATEIAERVSGTKPCGTTACSDSASSLSDVDIGVQPRRDIDIHAKERVGLTLELESLLGVPHIDLVILPEANALLAAEVVRGELIHAEDLDAEAEAQLYYLRRAGDLAPFYREQWKELLGSEL